MRNLIFIIIVFIGSPLYTQNIWEVLNFPDTLSPFSINAQKEGILFISTGGPGTYDGTFTSFDDGQTWNEIYLDSNNTSLESKTIQYTNDGLLFVGTFNSIYRSFDDGENFEQVYFESYGGNKLMISSDNDIYTVGWDNILRSQDLGITWDTVCDMNLNTIYYDMAFGNPGELYAVGIGWTSSHKGFYRSLDDGQTWENIGITDHSLHSIEINDEGILIAGGFSANQVFRSYDKGESWVQCSDIFADVMKSYNSDLLIATGNVNSNNGIWFSEDWGETWIDMIDEIISPYPWIREISISENNNVYVRSFDGTQQNAKLFKSTSPIVSIKSNPKNLEPVIFPNPCSSVLKISNITENYSDYIIYDLLGKIVLEGTIISKEINVSSLKPGPYIIMLKSFNDNLKIIFEKK